MSPAVVEQFREGRTLDHFRGRDERKLSARTPALDPEEQSLLSLLRSWRIRRARSGRVDASAQQRSRAKSAPITCTATFRTRTSPINPSGEP